MLSLYNTSPVNVALKQQLPKSTSTIDLHSQDNEVVELEKEDTTLAFWWSGHRIMQVDIIGPEFLSACIGLSERHFRHPRLGCHRRRGQPRIHQKPQIGSSSHRCDPTITIHHIVDAATLHVRAILHCS